MRKIIAAALVASLSLTGCSSVGQFVTSTATEMSSSTPSQATTLASALQAATLVTKAVDVYVNTANPSRATLLELQILNNQVHTTLVDLEHENAAGHSLVFAAFNEALRAFNSYATTKGVSH